VPLPGHAGDRVAEFFPPWQAGGCVGEDREKLGQARAPYGLGWLNPSTSLHFPPLSQDCPATVGKVERTLGGGCPKTAMSLVPTQKRQPRTPTPNPDPPRTQVSHLFSMQASLCACTHRVECWVMGLVAKAEGDTDWVLHDHRVHHCYHG
jgi:hypothetical protein